MTAPPCPAPPPTHLILLRHGATANNTADPPLLQGRRTDPPLSNVGSREAFLTAAALAREPIDFVFSSPLLRAMETARAIADVRGIAVTPVQDLIECDVGEWEGLSWPDIEARDPIAFRRFMDDPASHPYQGGESLSDVAARAIPALQGLIHSHPGSTLVVVAHNVVNRAYLATLLGIPLSRARSLIQANCGLNLVRSANGRAELVTLNSTWHLSTGLPNDPRVV